MGKVWNNYWEDLLPGGRGLAGDQGAGWCLGTKDFLEREKTSIMEVCPWLGGICLERNRTNANFSRVQGSEREGRYRVEEGGRQPQVFQNR